MKKTLYLMRHGQTLFNLRERIQGACDSPLTELGKKQAKIAKKYFIDNNISFDNVYCSTQERASDTLELITDMPYTRLKGIKEWNFGLFEGEPEYLNPVIYGKNSDTFFVDYGGEARKDVIKRATDTLTTLLQKEENNTILVVSHAAVCYNFSIKWANGQVTRPIKNCTIFKYEFYDNKFSLVDVIEHDFDSEI